MQLGLSNNPALKKIDLYWVFEAAFKSDASLEWITYIKEKGEKIVSQIDY